MAMATAKIAASIESNTKVLLVVNNKLIIITVIKLENKAKRIDWVSFFCALIKVKKQIDRAIRKIITMAKTPKAPTVAASSNKAPEPLSNLASHKGEALKSVVLYLLKP